MGRIRELIPPVPLHLKKGQSLLALIHFKRGFQSLQRLTPITVLTDKGLHRLQIIGQYGATLRALE